jgi:IS605 OrfB family transposase
MKGTSNQKKHVKSSVSISEHSESGKKKVKSKPLEQKEATDDTSKVTSTKSLDSNYQKQSPTKRKKSATQESLLMRKKKIWNDKLRSLEKNFQITKLSEISDLVSITKEKVLKPYWTAQSKVISKRLWLPTKIDCVDLVMSSSKESLKTTPMGRSWCSITKKHLQNKNSQMTSFRSSQFSLHDCTDLEVEPTLNGLKQIQDKKLKTLKFRLFPTEQQKKLLKLRMDQYRWYYNFILESFLIENKYNKNNMVNILGHYTFDYIRDEIARKYTYEEVRSGNVHVKNVFKKPVPDKPNEIEPKKQYLMFVPEWWRSKQLHVHNRVPRGAAMKFTGNINSIVSNYRAGNIKDFNLKFRSAKNPTDYALFEDSDCPKDLLEIESCYWFTDKDRKRKTISFLDVFNSTHKKGFEIIYEKATDRYFLHYPVQSNWFTEDDKRNSSQKAYVFKGNRVIALDPGVRKFLVGYDPTGESIFFGEGANKKISKILYQIDALQSKIKFPERKDDSGKVKHSLSRFFEKFEYVNSNEYTKIRNEMNKKYTKIKNMINELHWKSISFLIKNYDTIIYPDYRVQQMCKGLKLPRIVKRLMCMFSPYKFKQKLEWKCSLYGKKLVIVDESYTSCTCGICGAKANLKGKETFKCEVCDIPLDRDAHAARNIFLKNINFNAV